MRHKAAQHNSLKVGILLRLGKRKLWSLARKTRPTTAVRWGYDRVYFHHGFFRCRRARKGFTDAENANRWGAAPHGQTLCQEGRVLASGRQPRLGEGASNSINLHRSPTRVPAGRAAERRGPAARRDETPRETRTTENVVAPNRTGATAAELGNGKEQRFLNVFRDTLAVEEI